MQLTIDSKQSLDDVLRVVGALYDVTLQVKPDGTATAVSNSAPNSRSARSSSRSSGRRASSSSRPARGRSRASRASAGEVRSWAVKNGFEVSSRGRIPASVLSAYSKAHH